mgnify:CR=1 FL=1
MTGTDFKRRHGLTDDEFEAIKPALQMFGCGWDCVVRFVPHIDPFVVRRRSQGRHLAQQTSVDAFHGLTGLGRRQEAVLAVLKQEHMTNREVAARLGWEINRVTPRVNELMNMGLVTDFGTKWDKETGKRAIIWGAV